LLERYCEQLDKTFGKESLSRTTTWDTYPVIQGGNKTTTQLFYNDPSVQDALNAPHKFWEGCMPGEGRRRMLKHFGRRRSIPPSVGQLMLDHDRPLSMLGYIAELLDETDARVLIYNADLDMSVCAQGTENSLNAMKWSGADAWATRQRGLWVSPSQVDKVAGYAKEVKGLTFLVVRNSGHMVPYNQPENGLDLLTRFLKNESFYDEVVPFFGADLIPRSEKPAGDDSKFGTSRNIPFDVLLLAVGFGGGLVVSKQSRRGGYQPVKNNRN
jgi:Serine carboxypeptidase